MLPVIGQEALETPAAEPAPPPAAGTLVALWLAVLADMGTSLAVTLNGLRLFRRV